MTSRMTNSKKIVTVAEMIKKHLGKDYSKKHNCTLYSLVDIKVVYIISYAFISIINLISSTANIEATEDRQSTLQFAITSTNSGYVTEISDAVLWNCRDHSASAYYYKFLYWLLLISLALTVAGFTVTKAVMLFHVDNICTGKHGLKRLWDIAKVNKNLSLEKENEILILAQFMCECKNIWRTMIPPAVLLLVQIGLVLSYLSYDLHLLACIEGVPESSIQYYSEGNETGRVDIDISDHLLKFQLGAFIAVLIIILLVLLLALAFNRISKSIIQDMQNCSSDDCS